MSIIKLMGMLRDAVAELYAGRLVCEETSKSGFYCDFDLSEPINPEKMATIGKWLEGKEIPCAYELSGFSGAYQDGDRGKRCCSESMSQLLSRGTSCKPTKRRWQKRQNTTINGSARSSDGSGNAVQSNLISTCLYALG